MLPVRLESAKKILDSILIDSQAGSWWASDESLYIHSTSTIGDAPLEMTNITTAAGDPVQTSFSNNVGMFQQKFYIASAPSAEEPAPEKGVLSVGDTIL